MTSSTAIQLDKKDFKKLDRLAESHGCPRSSIVKRALVEYGRLSQRQIRKKKTNRMLNTMAFASMVSMFNALFYLGAFSLTHAVPVFVVTFIFTVSLFAAYKLVNRKRRK